MGQVRQVVFVVKKILWVPGGGRATFQARQLRASRWFRPQKTAPNGAMAAHPAVFLYAAAVQLNKNASGWPAWGVSAKILSYAVHTKGCCWHRVGPLMK